MMILRTGTNLKSAFQRGLAFTLMEMMAVVAIIMVMVGLLFPVIGNIKEQAKKAKARTEMDNLRIAIKAFYREYGYYPQTTSWTQFSAMLNGNVDPSSGVASGAGTWPVTNNTRAVKFMEFKITSVSTNAEFLDPWGNAYFVLCDWGNGLGAVGKAGWTDTTIGDEMVNNPAGGNIRSPIAIYSRGTDGADGNGADSTDDVKSWTN